MKKYIIITLLGIFSFGATSLFNTSSAAMVNVPTCQYSADHLICVSKKFDTSLSTNPYTSSKIYGCTTVSMECSPSNPACPTLYYLIHKLGYTYKNLSIDNRVYGDGKTCVMYSYPKPNSVVTNKFSSTRKLR